MKYRKKSIVIEAFEFNHEQRASNATWPTWLNQAWNLEVEETGAVFPTPGESSSTGTISIKTLEGVMKVSFGDFIIRGIDGELYPCKPDIFHKTYDEVTDTMEHSKAVFPTPGELSDS